MTHVLTSNLLLSRSIILVRENQIFILSYRKMSEKIKTKRKRELSENIKLFPENI